VTATGAVRARLTGTDREQGAAGVTLRTAAFALGWRAEPAPENDASLLFVRPTP